MGKVQARGGKANRKWGRHSIRSQAHKQYNAERRDITNKIRKLMQHIWRMEEYFNVDRQAIEVLKVLVKNHSTNFTAANRQLSHINIENILAY